MIQLFNGKNGMNLIGQGGKIIVFTLPFAAVAIWLQFYHSEIATLSWDAPIIPYIGYVLFIPGALLWASGLIQLLKDFPKGKLIKSGAYGVCRNPVYSSIILFVLPAISFITVTWVYFVVAYMLYLGVVLFIGKEEEKLKQTFGKEYEDYLCRVSRVIPFIKHLSKKS